MVLIDNLKKILFKLLNSKFFKYLFVGGFSLVIDMFLLFTITELFGISYLISASISYLIAFVVCFILNFTYTFKVKIKKLKNRTLMTNSVILSLTKYSGLTMFNYFVTMVVLFFLTEYFSIHYLISKMLVIIMIIMWNFFLYKYWVYK